MFRGVFLAACAWIGLAFCTSLAAARQDTAPYDCSYVAADGARTLCHEMVMPAPPAEVWPLFATTEGLASWLAPVAAIDLRIGGLWESSYRPDARIGDPGNIHNRILSHNPEKMLSIAVDRAPPGFPEPELVRTVWTVIDFEAIGRSRTRVRVSMIGYRQGEGYDRLYAMFKAGNAQTLQALHARVVGGPTDWAQRLNDSKVTRR